MADEFDAVRYGRHSTGHVAWNNRQTGRHRALCQHAFIRPPFGEFGCNHAVFGGLVRCAFPRRLHPTMVVS